MCQSVCVFACGRVEWKAVLNACGDIRLLLPYLTSFLASKCFKMPPSPLLYLSPFPLCLSHSVFLPLPPSLSPSSSTGRSVHCGLIGGGSQHQRVPLPPGRHRSHHRPMPQEHCRQVCVCVCVCVLGVLVCSMESWDHWRVVVQHVSASL